VIFQCVASKIDLPFQFLYYFGLYLVCKDPNADFTSIMLLVFLHLLNVLKQLLCSQLCVCLLTVLLSYLMFVLKEGNNNVY